MPQDHHTRADAPDYVNWLTKEQAADALGKSIKTIERYANESRKALRIRKILVAVPGRKSRPLYCPEDVAKVRKALDAEVLAAESAPASPAGMTIMRRPDAMAATLPLAEGAAMMAESSRSMVDAVAGLVALFQQSVQRLADMTAQQAELRVSIADKIVLTIQEAAQLGWPAAELRRLVREGQLRNFGGAGKYLVARRDLEQLLERKEPDGSSG